MKNVKCQDKDRSCSRYLQRQSYDGYDRLLSVKLAIVLTQRERRIIRDESSRLLHFQRGHFETSRRFESVCFASSRHRVSQIRIFKVAGASRSRGEKHIYSVVNLRKLWSVLLISTRSAPRSCVFLIPSNCKVPGKREPNFRSLKRRSPGTRSRNSLRIFFHKMCCFPL